MSWAGFGSYGSGASAYANRGGPLSSGYTRGGYRGGGGSYGFGASGLNSGSTSAYRTTGLSTAALSSAGPSRGTGTARVAVLGTTHSVFMHWWALHAAGFQVSVVVGALDAKRKEDISSAPTESDGESKTFASASAAEQLESAHAARDTALRCVEFYRLPKRASSSANGLTGVSPTTTTSQTSGVGVTTAGSTADSKAEALASVIVRLSDEKATASAVASAGGAASSSPPGTTTASSPSTATKTTTTLPYLGTAATTGSSATTTPTSSSSAVNKAEQDAKDGATITATSWSFFFKPFLEAQAGADSGAANSSGGGGGGVSNSGSGGLYGANRAMSGVQGADSLAGKAELLPLLVDDVEVVYLAAYTHIDTPTESFMDESALRAALIWLLGKGKHLVVDCALSCATVAACAAAAATTTRGKTEMQRLFVYRGGGTRYGWSAPAMTELRKALAVSRGTGQASKAADGSTAPASASSPTPTATTATTAKVAESPAGGKPKTPEAADAFSVFDFMGGDSNPFAGALKDADTTSSAAAAAAAATPHQASMSVSTKSLGDTAEPEKPKPPPTIVTSLALDAEAGVVGALRQVRLTVRGCGFGHGGPSTSPCSPSLGIMDTLGWDAVACVLHLLDWTCPDMVQGRVIRRCSSCSRAPLCVEAELFYGIDGSVPAAGEEEKKGTAAVEGGSGASDSSPQSQSTPTALVSAKDDDASQAGGSAPKPQQEQQQQCLPSRPAYLRVLLHIGAVGVDGSTGTADGSSSVFQQSLRAVGTKAVVTVTHPLLPAVSTAAVKLAASSAGGRESASPSPSQPATSPFKFTTTRTMSGAGLGAATLSASASAATAVAAGDPSLPGTPAVVYEYVVATQDAPPGSSGRLRKEKKTVVAAAAAAAAQSNGAEEACAEARLWQRVRGQLNVSSTTTAAGAASTTSSGFGVGGGGYQPYGSRYATRGRYGASVGLGGAAGGYYGRGRGVEGSAGVVSTAPQTVVKAEVNAAEAAALDVQRAWMVQMVVEQILASAASG